MPSKYTPLEDGKQKRILQTWAQSMAVECPLVRKGTAKMQQKDLKATYT